MKRPTRSGGKQGLSWSGSSSQSHLFLLHFQLQIAWPYWAFHFGIYPSLSHFTLSYLLFFVPVCTLGWFYSCFISHLVCYFLWFSDPLPISICLINASHRVLFLSSVALITMPGHAFIYGTEILQRSKSYTVNNPLTLFCSSIFLPWLPFFCFWKKFPLQLLWQHTPAFHPPP